MVVYNLRLFIIDSNNTIIEEHEIINALKYELTHVGWSKYENMTDIQKNLWEICIILQILLIIAILYCILLQKIVFIRL